MINTYCVCQHKFSSVERALERKNAEEWCARSHPESIRNDSQASYYCLVGESANDSRDGEQKHNNEDLYYTVIAVEYENKWLIILE